MDDPLWRAGSSRSPTTTLLCNVYQFMYLIIYLFPNVGRMNKLTQDYLSEQHNYFTYGTYLYVLTYRPPIKNKYICTLLQIDQGVGIPLGLERSSVYAGTALRKCKRVKLKFNQVVNLLSFSLIVEKIFIATTLGQSLSKLMINFSHWMS